MVRKKSSLNKFIYLFIVVLLNSQTSFAIPADPLVPYFTYQGQFLNSTGDTPLNDVVDLVLGIYDPSGTCLLYEESQANIDLSGTNGLFAVQVGSVLGNAKRSGSDPGLSMANVFANMGTQLRAASTTCPS